MARSGSFSTTTSEKCSFFLSASVVITTPTPGGTSPERLMETNGSPLCFSRRTNS